MPVPEPLNFVAHANLDALHQRRLAMLGDFGSPMPAESREDDAESLRLPKHWHSLVRSAVLNVVGIVRIAMLAGRETLLQNGDTKDARIHQLESEVAMLCEELRINDSRMRRIPPHRRPQYTEMERMAILQLRAMRGWNKSETSRHFLVSDDTIGSGCAARTMMHSFKRNHRSIGFRISFVTPFSKSSSSARRSER